MYLSLKNRLSLSSLPHISGQPIREVSHPLFTANSHAPTPTCNSIANPSCYQLHFPSKTSRVLPSSVATPLPSPVVQSDCILSSKQEHPLYHSGSTTAVTKTSDRGWRICSDPYPCDVNELGLVAMD
ncbi:hypothetical protein TNCT_738521 [Trichonephila clavata]|uniref:Uncharacterized protein n=1 Tax=Trichonephila clavata TaxID=2740835 RepID=A0A8X6IFU5_TRICU|nr:hypothetical protein TNCT_738521 [Trichonephila clavata]